MTVVQPNSIAGINSISVQSGNSLSIHKSDGTLIREIVAATGVSTYSSISVGSASTANNANKSINIGLGASIAQHDVNTLTFGTNGDPRATINSSGDVIIGSTSSTSVLSGGPAPLQVKGSDGYTGISIIRTASAGSQLQFAAGSSGDNVSNDDGLGYIKFFGYHTNGYDEYARIHGEVDGTNGDADAPGAIVFSTTGDGSASPDERLRITNDGKVVVGHTASSVVSAGGIESLNGSGNNFGAGRFVAGSGGPDFWFIKSRNANNGSHTVVQSGDTTGTIQFAGSDGDSWTRTAAIVSSVDGTPGDADMPGRLEFQTTADGASSPTERLRITSGGHIIAGGQGSTIAFNNVGNDSFGSVIEIDGSHTTDHHGMLSVVGKTDTNTNVVGRVQFINSQNSSGSSGSNAGSKNIAAIEGRITTGDSNAGDDSGGYLRFVTKAEAGGNAEAMRITSDGKIGIGDDTPASLLSLKASNPTIRFTDSSTLVGSIEGDTAANVYYGFNGADIVFSVHSATSYAPRLRINDTGRVLIGGQSDNSSAGGFENMLQVEGTGASSSSISVIRNSDDNNGPYISFGKSRGTSVNSNTIVANNDPLGTLGWYQSDGSGDFNNSASVAAYVDGAPGNSDAPTRLVFSTTADGANAVTERLRITSSGSWGLAGSNFGSSGQFLKSQGSGSPVVWGDASGGIDEADIWRLTTSFQGNASGGFIGSNWERGDSDGQNHKGTGMSESSGVFTFPSTGFWFVQFTFNMTTQYTPSQPHSHRNTGYIQTCIDGSSYAVAASSASGIYNFGSNSYPSHGTGTTSIIFDVTSTSNCKCRFNWGAGQGSETCTGDTSSNQTYVTFIRLADT